MNLGLFVRQPLSIPLAPVYPDLISLTTNLNDPFFDSGSHDTSARTDIHIPASG